METPLNISRRSFLTRVGAALTVAATSRMWGWNAAFLSHAASLHSTDQNETYAKIRGVNYYPSWTRSLPDLWTHYDPEAVRFELSLARGVGFNSIRVWLGTAPWEKLGDKMLGSVADFFAARQQFNLSVIPCIFDSCGVESSSYSGEVLPVPEAFERAMKNPNTTEASKLRMRAFAGDYVKTAGRNAMCPYSEEDSSTILWQWHAPSPGYKRLGRENWPKWEKYLRAVLGRFGDHPAVLAWDLMNEPNCIRIFNVPQGGGLPFDQKVVYDFIDRMRHVAESIKPRKPITIGAESQNAMHELASYAEVLSFHTYEADPLKLTKVMQEETAFAKEQRKPLLLTESAALLSVRTEADTGDAAQLELYRKSLPVLEAAGVGYYLVALMAGRFPFAWVGYLRPDGTRKVVADYIESVLKKQAALSP